jgi:hypothetical protein
MSAAPHVPATDEPEGPSTSARGVPEGGRGAEGSTRYPSAPASLVPADLDAMADPGAFMEQACARAKDWLVQAIDHGEIDQICEMKAQADAIRVYQAAKGNALDAGLSAAEIVRRCERGIGLAIRKGQEAGEIAARGDIGAPPPPGSNGLRPDGVRGTHLHRPSDFVSENDLRNGVYPMADPTDDQFEEAMDTAKAEKNLSRANLKRKLKPPPEERWDKVRRLATEGYSSRQIAEAVGLSFDGLRAGCRRQDIDVPADKVVGKTRRLDHERIVSETCTSLDGLVMGLGLVDIDALDVGQCADWATSLSSSITALTRFKNQLKEMTQ